MDGALPEVTEWLHKAESDLRSARILGRHQPPVLDTACFHCQQAVEKAFKAFLASRGVHFEKVHSLVYLIDLCEVEEPAFSSFRSGTELLAPYAVEIRYPGGPLEIQVQEVEEALGVAEAVWQFVLGLLQNESGSAPADPVDKTV